MRIGYHASHEQFPPSELLGLVKLAEAAGFDAAMASDHISPFSLRQGESGFVWSWLGAALETTKLSFGTVNAPGQRYHPAIVAQAIATLAQMYPGRVWTAFGSGQFINEHVTGSGWPTEEERDERLRECAQIIRRLLAGETVDHEGLVSVKQAKLYSRPDIAPLILGAAVTPETASFVASWADGMITVAQPKDELAKVVSAFRAGGGQEKPMFLQAQVSYDSTYEAALEGAWDQWRMSLLPSDQLVNAATPEEIDRLTTGLNRDDLKQRVRISADLDQHVAWLIEDRCMGFDAVYIHNVNRKQASFIEAFGATVLPSVREWSAAR
jgi:coenzyme F420-dependent glucose-6-phosphate dehydrogenase